MILASGKHTSEAVIARNKTKKNLRCYWRLEKKQTKPPAGMQAKVAKSSGSRDGTLQQAAAWLTVSQQEHLAVDACCWYYFRVHSKIPTAEGAWYATTHRAVSEAVSAVASTIGFLRQNLQLAVASCANLVGNPDRVI